MWKSYGLPHHFHINLTFRPSFPQPRGGYEGCTTVFIICYVTAVNYGLQQLKSGKKLTKTEIKDPAAGVITKSAKIFVQSPQKFFLVCLAAEWR